MTIRPQLLETTSLNPPPVVEPAFDLRDPMAWPVSPTALDWSTASPEQIYAAVSHMIMWGTPGQPTGGLL